MEVAYEGRGWPGGLNKKVVAGWLAGGAKKNIAGGDSIRQRAKKEWCPASMLFLVFASSGLEAKANVNMSTQVKSDGVLLQCSTSARIQPAITAGYDHRHDR